MDSVLRQSKSVCPFMRKASAATLRAMSTSARPGSSPCGGTMSNLQVLARRCPVMGKALAVQSARMRAGHAMMSTRSAGHAALHTTTMQKAQPVDGGLFHGREQGEWS